MLETLHQLRGISLHPVWPQTGDGRTLIGTDFDHGVFAELRDSPTRAALRQLIADLEPKARLELIALMWIGRGDTDDDDFVTALEQAEHMTDAGDVDCLAGKGPLARYLRAGLERIGAP